MTRAAVIVLSWNGGADLADCLEALHTQQGAAAEVVVVDNGSSDRSPELVRRRFPGARLVENGYNMGFSAGMNVGIRLLRADPQPPEVVVLLNQDTVVAADWLRHILAPFAQDERIGAVGCKIFYPDGRTLQHAGKALDPGRGMTRHFGYRERDEGQHDQPRDLEAVTGAAMALRMSALDEVGLLDEGYSPAYYEDDDLCWRLRRAGYLVRYQPAATLRHGESRSIADEVRRSALMHRNRLRFVVKTFPPERIWNDFFVAERTRLAVLLHGTEARTLRRAYLEGIMRSDEWVAARSHYYPPAPDEALRIRRLCVALRREIAAFDRDRWMA